MVSAVGECWGGGEGGGGGGQVDLTVQSCSRRLSIMAAPSS